MSGDTRSYSLNISEHFFHLTTESVRLHSNETQQYQSLTNLVNDRVSSSDPLEDHAPETIRQHLSAIPTTGDIRIHLSITESSAGNIDEVKRRLSESLGSDVSLGDTLSILLFHYVVGRKAEEILNRLALDSQQSASGSQSVTGNVLPIR